MIINKAKIGLSAYSSWCALGFIRGLNHYDYKHNKYNKDNLYLYSGRIGIGLFGFICYANPFFMPIFFTKEIYRCEVKLRNLEQEKNSDNYNELF